MLSVIAKLQISRGFAGVADGSVVADCARIHRLGGIPNSVPSRVYRVQPNLASKGGGNSDVPHPQSPKRGSGGKVCLPAYSYCSTIWLVSFYDNHREIP